MKHPQTAKGQPQRPQKGSVAAECLESLLDDMEGLGWPHAHATATAALARSAGIQKAVGVEAGRKGRDTALDGFEARPLLTELRAHAQAVARAKGQVSANDIRHLVPPEVSRNGRNILGAVFRGKDWRSVGWTQSDLPAGHARWIQVWAWVAP